MSGKSARIEISEPFSLIAIIFRVYLKVGVFNMHSLTLDLGLKQSFIKFRFLHLKVFLNKLVAKGYAIH